MRKFFMALTALVALSTPIVLTNPVPSAALAGNGIIGQP
jgi:hypothetical protein